MRKRFVRVCHVRTCARVPTHTHTKLVTFWRLKNLFVRTFCFKQYSGAPLSTTLRCRDVVKEELEDVNSSGNLGLSFPVEFRTDPRRAEGSSFRPHEPIEVGFWILGLLCRRATSRIVPWTTCLEDTEPRPVEVVESEEDDLLPLDKIKNKTTIKVRTTI